ncbi:galactitol-1-phosphate 5-dehydrogenase [Anaerofustis butyriciformans]|uniref:galactitol-1-phosphate 5-dehydrogenase n=1 Tax=Anaerofustis butyriciformans TaxID=3108533 RepID=UPI002E3171B7|nr:galactitol-1-phosphate 5-dehydrogenase [Anaerofustis sp. HA2171]
MKAARLYGVQDLRLEDVPKPEAKPGEVLIKVKAVGICGSDLSRYRSHGPKFPEKGIFTFGHEFSGQIEAVGEGVTKFKAGDRVTACPALPCFECEYCKKGEYARCMTLEVIGAVRDGAYAEYITMPEVNVVPIPDNVTYEQAAVIEPTAVVYHGLYKTKMQPGDDVAVMGCGPIGLLSILVAKVFGAKRIIAIDIMEEKLEWAKQCGATDVVLSKIDDYNSARNGVLEVTNGRGADVVIESGGTPITSAQVLGLGCKGAKVLYLGIPYGDVNIPREYFEKIGRSELTVYGSWNAIQQGFPGKPWTSTVAALEKGLIDYSPIITHRYALDDIEEVFKANFERKTLFGKIMFFPEGVEK